jgi:hypothetical protein
MPKGKTYVFVFQSVLGVGVSTNEHFFVDWSRIPNKPYRCTFTFSSASFTVDTTVVPNVFMDLAGEATIFANNANVIVNGRTGYLGMLSWSGNGAGQHLLARLNDNVPTYLDSRPFNNNVNVAIVTNTGNQITPYPTNPAQWTLNLCLEQLED